MMRYILSLLLSAVLLGLFWVTAKGIKKICPVLKRLFLPCALIAGLIALPFNALQIIPRPAAELWSSLPALLINVVFACLFLGKTILSPRQTWKLAGPQVIFGQTLAWGQYVVGILLTWLVLTPVFGIPPLAGALIEISFEGGHGTAAGLGPVFENLGFSQGTDLAVGLATIGMVAGLVSGIILVNWAHRKEKTRGVTREAKKAESRDPITLDDEAHPPTPHWLERIRFISILLHAGHIAVSIIIGRLLLDGLILVEKTTWGRDGSLELMESMPLFPLAMLGGVIVQFTLVKLKLPHLIDRRMINAFGTVALDILIVTAVATMSLGVLGEYAAPMALIAAAGISWNILAFLFLAPRLIPRYWFERGIGDFGQSMGMTATGLLLMRITDPENSSRALESFGYKQLFFEPIVGGGIFTASSMILISQFGQGPVLVFTAAAAAGWVIFGLVSFRNKKPSG